MTNQTQELLPFQQRVVDEREELMGRLGKLREFLMSERFSELSDAERFRMTRQEMAMTIYAEVLQDRIAAWR